MVKKAFVDQELINHMQLTSANSINVARWLPQLFYFLFAYKTLKQKQKHQNVVFSIPSGNFGNICAGMVAQKLGMPVKHFIASNNENNVVTRYLKTGVYDVKPSVQTISNAMDVGSPSNFIRIQELHNNDFETLKSNLSSYYFTDDATREALDEIYTKYGYIADPHGAVGYLGCKAYLETQPNAHCVFLETAHPTKFLDVVEEVIQTELILPEQIKAVMDKTKTAIAIEDYQSFKNYLLSKKF